MNPHMCTSWIRQSSIMSILLTLLGVYFLASVSTENLNLLSRVAISTMLSDDVHHHENTSKKQNHLWVAYRIPPKAISLSLVSLLRNWFFSLECFHNATPNYELVFDFEFSDARMRLSRIYNTFEHWHDWILRNFTFFHRISGW